MLELLFGKSPTPSVLAIRARSGKSGCGIEGAHPDPLRVLQG